MTDHEKEIRAALEAGFFDDAGRLSEWLPALLSELTSLREERDRFAKAEGHLNAVVDAWEALPGGRRIRVEEVEAWLVNEMAAIINVTRAYLGRPLPGARALIQETSE